MMYGGDRTLRSSGNAQTNSSKEASMATYTMQELELETAELLPARETLCRTCYGTRSGGVFQAGLVNVNANNDNINVLSGNLSGNGFLGGMGGSGNGSILN